MHTWNLLRLGAIVSTLFLAGCELGRSDAENILNSPAGRPYACVTGLQFIKGGFERAKNAGVITALPSESGLLGAMFLAANIPGGDRWQVFFLGYEENPTVSRKQKKNECIPGKVEITALADVPFAPIAGGYKMVEFIEVPTVPTELKPLEPYVFLKYSKSTVLQKTDNGWRVAQ